MIEHKNENYYEVVLSTLLSYCWMTNEKFRSEGIAQAD